MTPPPLRRRLLDRVLLGLIVLVVVAYVSPYLYLVLTSIKPSIEAISIPPRLLPTSVDLSNFASLLSNSAVQRGLINSVTVAVLSTGFSLFLGVPAAYGITRYGTIPGKVFIVAALATRMVPYVSLGIPFFAVMVSLGLRDTQVAIALAHTTINLPLVIWLMASFFEGLPQEVEEAARIDGCTRLGALWRVILPMVTGGVAVTGLFAFLASWNEFLFALLLSSVDAKTTPILIAELQTQFGLEWGSMTGLAVIYSLPVVLLALVLQRRIVAGLAPGAVKG